MVSYYSLQLLEFESVRILKNRGPNDKMIEYKFKYLQLGSSEFKNHSYIVIVLNCVPKKYLVIQYHSTLLKYHVQYIKV